METGRAISRVVTVPIVIRAGVVSTRIARRTVAVAPVAVIRAIVISVSPVVIPVVIAVVVSVSPVVIAVMMSAVAVIGIIGAPAVSQVILSQHLLAIVIQINAALIIAAVPVAAVTFVNSQLRAVEGTGAADDVCCCVLNTEQREQQSEGKVLHIPLSKVARVGRAIDTAYLLYKVGRDVYCHRAAALFCGGAGS